MRRRHRGLCCARQFKSSTEGRRRLPPTSTPTVRAALDQRRRVTTVRRLLPVRRNSIKSTSTAATAMITQTHGSMTRLLPLSSTLTPDGPPAHPVISPSSHGPCDPEANPAESGVEVGPAHITGASSHADLGAPTPRPNEAHTLRLNIRDGAGFRPRRRDRLVLG